MDPTPLHLTREQRARLRGLAARTGRTPSDLLREALDRIEVSASDRAEMLHQAYGLWKGQPHPEGLRHEADSRLGRLYGDDERA